MFPEQHHDRETSREKEIVPTSLDVVVGRGNYHRPGNVKLLQRIRKFAPEYSATKIIIEKNAIACRVIREIVQGGGRFLTRCQKSRSFGPLDLKTVLKKVKQGFRDQLVAQGLVGKRKGMAPATTPTSSTDSPESSPGLLGVCAPSPDRSPKVMRLSPPEERQPDRLSNCLERKQPTSCSAQPFKSPQDIERKLSPGQPPLSFQARINKLRNPQGIPTSRDRHLAHQNIVMDHSQEAISSLELLRQQKSRPQAPYGNDSVVNQGLQHTAALRLAELELMRSSTGRRHGATFPMGGDWNEDSQHLDDFSKTLLSAHVRQSLIRSSDPMTSSARDFGNDDLTASGVSAARQITPSHLLDANETSITRAYRNEMNSRLQLLLREQQRHIAKLEEEICMRCDPSFRDGAV